MESSMKRNTEKAEVGSARKETNDPSQKRSKQNKEISTGDTINEDETQIVRKEAYLEVETQRLLRELLQNQNQKEIFPSYDSA